jgi:hypothetical protein
MKYVIFSLIAMVMFMGIFFRTLSEFLYSPKTVAFPPYPRYSPTFYAISKNFETPHWLYERALVAIYT